MGCPVVIVELLYDARDSEEVERVATALAGLEQARITAAHWRKEPYPASKGSSAESLTSVSASSAAGSESRTTPTPA